MRAGEYNYLPCLNERDDWIHALVNLVKPHLAAMQRPPVAAAALQQQASYARALGAKA